jgi:hypothetical protein
MIKHNLKNQQRQQFKNGSVIPSLTWIEMDWSGSGT